MAEVFLFEGGELRVATRELLVGGQPRALEPRPFDLLAYLLAHADRVVPRDELLTTLWRGDADADGALARSVLKLRRALGDGATHVRTVNRRGYRYAGAVERRAAAARSAGALSLLPVVNATGQPGLDWVELGLLSLVLRELAAGPAVATVPVAALLTALQTCAADADIATRAAALRRLAGARDVLHATVHWNAGGYRLAIARIGGDGLAEPAGELHAAEPPALAPLLARWIAQRHGAGGAVSAAAADADVGALLGPALQAIAHQRWHLALERLDAVLVVAPDHRGAQRERLRALAALDDDRAFALGEALLETARRGDGDRELAAAARLELAQAFHRRRLIDRAKTHLDALLADGAPYALSSELAIATTLLRASIAMFEIDFARAAALLDDAERRCRAEHRVFELIRVESLRLIVAAETGDMRGACAHAERAAALYRDHGLIPGQARAECNVANASASLGRLRVAAQRCETAIALSRSVGVATDAAVSASVLAGIQRALKQPASLARTVDRLEAMPPGDAPRTDLFALVCRAHLALARGEDDRAVELLERARREAETGGALPLHFVLPLLAWAQIGAGRWMAAERSCAAIEAQPAFARDRNLRGALLHARAQLALAAGERAECARLLREAIAVAPEGWWHAHARIDAAWLAVEDGGVGAARALVAGMADWLAEFPPARALQVRLWHLEGRREEARAGQALLLAAIEGEVPDLYGALLGELGSQRFVLTRL